MLCIASDIAQSAMLRREVWYMVWYHSLGYSVLAPPRFSCTCSYSLPQLWTTL